MKLRPILFSTPMVLALLAGTKTQTRRLLKPQPILTERRYMRFAEVGSLHVTQDLFPTSSDRGLVFAYKESAGVIQNMGTESFIEKFCKYKVGDVLWVRETWAAHFMWNGVKPSDITFDGRNCLYYRADGENPHAATCNCKDHQRGVWRPSLFMPFEACRLFLELVSIRVERLNDISEEDSISEGAVCTTKTMHAVKEYDDIFPSARQHYHEIWESINGIDSWSANPFVWVYEFKLVDKPVEKIAENRSKTARSESKISKNVSKVAI